MTQLTQPLGADERSRIEEDHWNSDAIKVWPLGPQGPCLTLRELAAWRAERCGAWGLPAQPVHPLQKPALRWKRGTSTNSASFLHGEPHPGGGPVAGDHRGSHVLLQVGVLFGIDDLAPGKANR